MVIFKIIVPIVVQHLLIVFLVILFVTDKSTGYELTARTSQFAKRF